MHREDEGGRVVSLSSSPSMEDLELGGVHPHPFAAHPIARRALSLSLSPSPCFHVGGMLCLPPCRILGRVGISRLATTAPKTLCKATSAMKR
jgi:hypothetical protein